MYAPHYALIKMNAPRRSARIAAKMALVTRVNNKIDEYMSERSYASKENEAHVRTMYLASTLRNMIIEINKHEACTVLKIQLITSLFKIMNQPDLKNISLLCPKFMGSMKNKINEMCNDIQNRNMPYHIAIDFYNSVNSLKAFIQEIENSSD